MALLSTEFARHAAVRAHFGTVCTIVFACVLAGTASPAEAHRVERALRIKQTETEHVSREPFGNIPKGPLQIIISIDQQELHLYSNGTHVADTPIATGVPAHPTPQGIFSIIQKDRHHRSNIYSAAPMPYMERVTWSGVALHEGRNLGHPASHGCIRMSHDFAVRLWALTKLGVRVIIARSELRPQEIADPHLFVHQPAPTTPDPTASAPAVAKPLKTAQSTDTDKTADASHEQAKHVADIVPIGSSFDPPANELARELRPSVPGTSDAARPASVAAVDPAPAAPSQAIVIAHASKSPISIFISRKTKKIYVRQDFSPLFDAPVTIEHPDEPLGTHVFTAMQYLGDHASFRWNVVSLPGEPAKAAQQAEYEKKPGKYATAKRRQQSRADLSPPQTPQQALARIEIPQDVIAQISQLIVPGSSLIVSDQGLGSETGEGTDFIVVIRDSGGAEADEGRYAKRPSRRADDIDRVYGAQAPRWQQPWQEQWE